jgi:hypothetical protein
MDTGRETAAIIDRIAHLMRVTPLEAGNIFQAVASAIETVVDASGLQDDDRARVLSIIVFDAASKAALGTQGQHSWTSEDEEGWRGLGDPSGEGSSSDYGVDRACYSTHGRGGTPDD